MSSIAAVGSRISSLSKTDHAQPSLECSHALARGDAGSSGDGRERLSCTPNRDGLGVPMAVKGSHNS